MAFAPWRAEQPGMRSRCTWSLPSTWASAIHPIPRQCKVLGPCVLDSCAQGCFVHDAVAPCEGQVKGRLGSQVSMRTGTEVDRPALRARDLLAPPQGLGKAPASLAPLACSALHCDVGQGVETVGNTQPTTIRTRGRTHAGRTQSSLLRATT
jgi:hypothetical protein